MPLDVCAALLTVSSSISNKLANYLRINDCISRGITSSTSINNVL